MRYLVDFFAKTNRGLHYGFTLVEVLIIVFTLGIVATLALPALQSGIEESKLSGASSEITVALEYSQIVAMTSGEQTRVTIDAASDTILVERFEISGDLTGAVIPEDDIEIGAFATMPHPASRGKNYYIVFADEPRFNGVDIVSATFGGGQTVTFDAMGVPSPSGGGTVTLTLGSQQVIVTVDALGKVTTNS